MKHGQKDLAREIEHAIQCCDERDCLHVTTWPGNKCRNCGKACGESCEFFIGAINIQRRENRWYLGKFLFRRGMKRDPLPEGYAMYLALEDNPLCKAGTWVEGLIKEFYTKPREEK